MGLVIADCQVPISDWRLPLKAIGNRQLPIENAAAPSVDGFTAPFYARADSHG